MTDTPDVRFPSIEALRAFEAAARLGTFERAADELSVTASAVGKRIGTLEELLGAMLFERTGKALALTAAGKEYLGQVRAALSLLAAMPLHSRRSQRVQRLRVTAPPTFARQILVPRLPEFTQAEPSIELEVVMSIPYLDRSVVDSEVEIRHGDAHAAGAEPLMHDCLLPVASPALLERLSPPPRTPAELAHAPLLRSPIDPWAPWLRAAGLEWPEPAEGPRLIDLGLTLVAALAGQGVALARPTLALPWLRSGQLRAPFTLTVPADGLYHLLPHADSGAAPVFARWLRAVCADADAAARAWLSARG
jgi:DNA-binding transcriptional LysR family regulator